MDNLFKLFVVELILGYDFNKLIVCVKLINDLSIIRVREFFIGDEGKDKLLYS